MHSEMIIMRADHLRQVGNISGAEKLLRGLLGEDPDNGEALALLALCTLAREKLAAARGLADQATIAAPESEFSHRVLGIILDRQKQYSQAEEALKIALHLSPEEPLTHIALAHFYERRSKNKQAEQFYRSALALDPNNIEALTHYGDYLIGVGRADEARILLDQAAKIQPDNGALILALGEQAFRVGNLDEARERALWVLSINSEDAGALALLAKVKLRRNPIMGLWFQWALWMQRFDGKQKLLILVGLYVGFQVLYRVLLAGGPPLVRTIALSAWLGFVLLTWVAPYILARTIASETKSVDLDKGF